MLKIQLTAPELEELQRRLKKAKKGKPLEY